MEKFFDDNKSKRKFLCNHYDIQIIRRFRLILGQEIRGIYRCIKDLVYEFRAHNKKYPNNKPFFFHTGRTAGDDFIQHANITNIPPIFSLLENIQQFPIAQEQNNAGNNNQQANRINIDPLNREMLNIFNMFFYLYGLDPEKPSFKIYERIISNPTKFDYNNLKSINTIISHKHKLDIKSFITCVQNKLQENEVDGNLRHFNFNGLIACCKMNPLPTPSLF